MNWIIGGSTAQRVFLLEKFLGHYSQMGSVVTNLEPMLHGDFDEDRIQKLKDMDDCRMVTDHGQILRDGDRLIIRNSKSEFSQDYLDIITLLCRKGDYLVLNEPELALPGMEQMFLEWILREILPTYKGGIVSTCCERFFSVEPQNFYWCSNRKLRKISGEELNECIVQLDRMGGTNSRQKIIRKMKALGKSSFFYKNGKYFISGEDILLEYVDCIDGGFTIPWFVSGIYRECEEWLNISPFVNCRSLSVINKSEITDISGMFSNCPDLTDLDLSEFDFSHIVKMDRLFAWSESLQEINMSGIIIPPGTKGMFDGCTALKKVIG